MMKIDIDVKGNVLENNGSYRITNGSINDVYIAFHFEPGYGWEAASVTAVFTRYDKRSYRVGVKNGVYVAVPASVLNTTGNVFVSLVGTIGGETVMTSTTTSFVVEYNGLDTLNPSLLPVKDGTSELDRNAYAQYVAVVNELTARAENAARKAEDIGAGWYTKQECDDRYAKKLTVTMDSDGSYDASVLSTSTVPTIKVKALPPQDTEGSVSSPANLSCIDTVRVRISGEKSSSENVYGGFKLRYLNKAAYDKLVIDKNGCKKLGEVHELAVKDAIGQWVDETHYMVSLVTAPNIELSMVGSIITNVGKCVSAVDMTSITLVLPASTTQQELDTIVIWYPVAEGIVTPVSAAGLTTFADNQSNINVFQTIAGDESEASFSVTAELDMAKYVSKFAGQSNDVVAELEKALARIQALENTLETIRISDEATIKESDWYADCDENWYCVDIKRGLRPVALTLHEGLDEYHVTTFHYEVNASTTTIHARLAGGPCEATLTFLNE